MLDTTNKRFPGQDKRDMRQVALEVLGVALTIVRMMQEPIDVVEDIPLADLLAILRLELLERPIGDVLAPVAAVFGVGVEGETLMMHRHYATVNRE